MAVNPTKDFDLIYQKLFSHFGPQNWWPGETQLEIIVGAILTQNTNWSNVEKAISNLKSARMLNLKALNEISQSRLAELIRPSGYFNVKAKRLKNFIHFVFSEYGGSLQKLQDELLEELRVKLLKINGIGPETADSILLYALNKPAFVVDSYTKRFLYRHNLISREEDYTQVQGKFLASISSNIKIFNEYHALIVRLAKDFCRTHPKCEQCPLRNFRYSLEKRCRVCYRFEGAVKCNCQEG